MGGPSAPHARAPSLILQPLTACACSTPLQAPTSWTRSRAATATLRAASRDWAAFGAVARRLLKAGHRSAGLRGAWWGWCSDSLCSRCVGVEMRSRMCGSGCGAAAPADAGSRRVEARCLCSSREPLCPAYMHHASYMRKNASGMMLLRSSRSQSQPHTQTSQVRVCGQRVRAVKAAGPRHLGAGRKHEQQTTESRPRPCGRSGRTHSAAAQSCAHTAHAGDQIRAQHSLRRAAAVLHEKNLIGPHTRR